MSASSAPFNNIVGADPLLTDPANGNYQPERHSPARAYGCQTFTERAGSKDEPQPLPVRPAASTRSGVIDVAGSISADTVWNADTVRVVGDVTVEDDVTLTIEPGVRVEFQGYYGLDVDGTVIAVGTPRQRILFTTDDPQSFAVDATHTGCWNGIRFENTRSTNVPSRLEYCTFEYSKATGGGGGQYPYAGGALSVVDYSDLTVEHCILRKNVADHGGAMFLYRNANPAIRGNLIVDNHALGNASALYCAYSYPEIANNTLVRNTIQNEANPYFESAGLLGFLAKPAFANNVVRQNDPVVDYHHTEFYGAKPHYTRNNNIAGYGHSGGNIDADPLFVDPDGSDDLPATPDDDFRLQAGSPCVDAGRNSAVPVATSSDIDGGARLVDGDDDGTPVVDMGAFEFPHGSALSFEADAVTLSWRAFGGAEAYNVYRGFLADLVDVDTDGLPDGGYGSCIDHLDPDTSDTTLLDPASPDPGEGFFYVMSTVDALGQERFLGTTSAGLPREILSPCP